VGIAQRTLASEMVYEVALPHSQEPVGVARLLERFASLSRR
jgi:hypothetical protein